MFLDQELDKYRNSGKEPSMASTQWSQMTQAPETGTSNMVDIFYICPANPNYPSRVFFLVVSDGQRFGVAIISESALMNSGHFDLAFQTTRSAVICHNGFLPANKETMSPAFQEYVMRLNIDFTVLSVSSMALQGRGPVLPRPPTYADILLPPSNEEADDESIAGITNDMNQNDMNQISVIQNEAPQTRPGGSFEAERASRFRPLSDDSDDTDGSINEASTEELSGSEYSSKEISERKESNTMSLKSWDKSPDSSSGSSNETDSGVEESNVESGSPGFDHQSSCTVM